MDITPSMQVEKVSEPVDIFAPNPTPHPFPNAGSTAWARTVDPVRSRISCLLGLLDCPNSFERGPDDAFDMAEAKNEIDARISRLGLDRGLISQYMNRRGRPIEEEQIWRRQDFATRMLSFKKAL